MPSAPLLALTVLLVAQLAGEGVVRALALPVPGPVAGVLLVLSTLAALARWRGADPLDHEAGRAFRGVAEGLLRHLGLLFVPAGAGALAFAGSLAPQLPALALILVLSTLLTLLVTVGLFRLAQRWGAR